jgi:hypothetical protein
MIYTRRRVNGVATHAGAELLDIDDDLDVDIDEDVDIDTVCFPTGGLDDARERASSMVRRFWAMSCRVSHFTALPDWLQVRRAAHSTQTSTFRTTIFCTTVIECRFRILPAVFGRSSPSTRKLVTFGRICSAALRLWASPAGF